VFVAEVIPTAPPPADSSPPVGDAPSPTSTRQPSAANNPSATASPGAININTASQTELETLPRIGPAIALRIIEYRSTYGPFARIEDIKNVKGIGDATFEAIKDYITVK
ncbi:MAG: ComEA family DNA-binding protein, partial [Chloroflexota bacterium]